MTASIDVFLNFPFDEEYRALRDALVFVTLSAGFRPRCALEDGDSGRPRIERLYEIIRQCPLGIHDISRTEPDAQGLPRFNMPFELGVFLGAMRFGNRKQQAKRCLILDRERFRFQKFLSDLGGNDPQEHSDDPLKLSVKVRNWLCHSVSDGMAVPSGARLTSRFLQWNRELPDICALLGFDHRQLEWKDRAMLIEEWLRKTAQG